MIRSARQLTPMQIWTRLLLRGRFIAYRLLPILARAQIRGTAQFEKDAIPLLRAWLKLRHPYGASAPQRELAATVLDGRGGFVGRSAYLGQPINWRPRGESRLWQYHLHYFDYLVAIALSADDTQADSALRKGWLIFHDWLRANPVGSTPGWESYPVAVRLVNLAGAWALSAESADAFPGGGDRLIQILSMHARFLVRHLEFDIGGNHLIKEARALLLAGRILNSSDSGRWLQVGRRLLRRELGRQVLSDGGHAERSPLYHAAVLEDILDCLVLDSGLRDLEEVAQRMARWLEYMRHADGGLALFNDTVAFADRSARETIEYYERVIAPDPAATTESLAAGVALNESGYYVITAGDGRMIIDCGDIGPPNLAAHAHADTLSFELDWQNRRVIVDSGVSEYAPGELRNYVRSTRAHNTVVVDGLDQSEVWGAHRVGRRARPLGANLESFDGGVRFSGAHDGYRRRGVIHCRHVVATGRAWIVVDEFLGRGDHLYESLIHIHPDAAVRIADGDLKIVVPGLAQPLRLHPLGAGSVAILAGRYCPGWGDVRANQVLRLAATRGAPTAIAYAIAPHDMTLRVLFRQHETGVTISANVENTETIIECTRPDGAHLAESGVVMRGPPPQ